MRCPDCNKFVSYDDSTEPEVEAEVSEEGAVTGTVRIVLTCGECGTELKGADFEIDNSDAVDDFAKHVTEKVEEAKKEAGAKWDAEAEEAEREKHELEVDADGASLTSRVNNVDRHGKPIKNRRYMATFYGYETDIVVKCSCGDFEFTGQSTDEITASGMDELV